MEVINFLEVTNSLEKTFLLEVIVILGEVACFVGITYVKDAITEGLSTKNTGNKSTCIEEVCTRSTYFRSACVGSASDVKCLGMHLQFFEIWK